MSAQTTDKPQRVTWRDWQPPGTPDPDELMTREEFVARLNDLAVDVDGNDLRYWEALGVLPRGVRKRRDKVTRVYYPRWLMQSVQLLRDLQGLGLSLEEIGPRLKAAAAEAVGVAKETENTPMRPGRPGRPSCSTRGDVTLLNWTRTITEPARLELLMSDLVRLARRYEAITGNHPDLVRVSFVQLQDGTERELSKSELRNYGHPNY